MRQELEKKVNRAIRLIKNTVGGGTVEVSYSGGKDSDVILELTRMAGVNYRAIYKNTTIDPPYTHKHCRDNGVEILNPKISFLELIAKRGFPTRRARFCCEVLKEYKVMDMAIQGIRRSESTARSKRYSESDPVICRNYGSKKNHVDVILPILSWTDEDVAEFLEERKVKAHPLYYDEHGNFHPERRLGCLGCPLAQKAAIEDFKQYPNLLKAWLRAGLVWWETHPNAKSHQTFGDIYELLVHNLFYRTYDKFRQDFSEGLFQSKTAREFLEDKFGVSLSDLEKQK